MYSMQSVEEGINVCKFIFKKAGLLLAKCVWLEERLYLYRIEDKVVKRERERKLRLDLQIIYKAVFYCCFLTIGVNNC